MLSGNSLRQTAHTHRASVHQAAKLVAALLRVVRVTAGLAESNGSLPPVFDSYHLQADCQELGSAPDPTLGNREWATFTFFTSVGGSRQHGYDVYDVFVHVFVRTPVSW